MPAPPRLTRDCHHAPAHAAADALHWQVAALTELDPLAVHALLGLRSRVFVVEQACAYLDPDAHDAHPDTRHLLGWQGTTLMACARVLPPGATFTPPSIGRLLVSAERRGQGLGHALLQRAIVLVDTRWPGQPIALAAQAHLQAFYAAAGFIVMSAPYDEDGIAHVDMQRPATATATDTRSTSPIA